MAAPMTGNKWPGGTVGGVPAFNAENIAARDKMNRRYQRDPRIIAARKTYRAALKAGVRETIAWADFELVAQAVRRDLGID